MKKTLLDVVISKDDDSRFFQYDAVFNKDNDPDVVFADCEDLVVSALDGYNATIFAYGQTGSGKTHTMFGTLCFSYGWWMVKERKGKESKLAQPGIRVL